MRKLNVVSVGLLVLLSCFGEPLGAGLDAQVPTDSGVPEGSHDSAASPGLLPGGAFWRICASSQQGTYTRLASAISSALRKGPGELELQVVQSSGSFENAQKIRDGECDLALIQQDVAYLEYFNGQPFLALGQLYVEPIHIVAHRGLELKRLSGLALRERKKPYRISIGPDGSGSQAHALMLLGELELKPEQLELHELHISQAIELMRRGELDLAFATSAVPVAGLVEPGQDGWISLLAIDPDIAKRLRQRHPFLFPAQIPYRSYFTSGQDLPTLGVKTLLVGRPDLANDFVERLLDAAYSLPREATSTNLPFLQDLSPRSGLSGVSMPTHPASLTYHRTHQSWITSLGLFLKKYGLALLILLLPGLVFWRLSRVAYFVHQFRFGRVLFALLTIWLVGSALMYLLEGARSSSFRSFRQTAIAMVHYLFSGLESKYPTSLAGEITAILMLTLGAAVVAIFSATLVSSLMEKMLYLEQVRKKPFLRLKLKNHVVISTWSDRTERIIRQLRSKDISPRPQIVVIASDAKKARFSPGKRTRGVWLVEGEASHSRVLKQADIQHARAALILSKRPRLPEEDMRSLATALAVETQREGLHTVIEASFRSARGLLKGRSQQEVVSTPALTERMLSQVVITPGITRIYGELLTFGSGSQEIRFIPLPKSCSNHTFQKIALDLISSDAIPIGYRKSACQSLILNPRVHDRGRSEVDYCLQPASETGPGDMLIVLADDSQALSARTLRRNQRRRIHLHQDHGGKPMPTEKLPPSLLSPKQAEQGQTRIIICGWTEKTREILEQLQSAVVAAHHRFLITVLCETSRAKFEKTNGDYLQQDVCFIFGDPTRREVLENAGLAEMDSLVILSEGKSGKLRKYADHRTLMIALAASDVNSKLHIVAEVLDSQNQEHFSRVPQTEVVSVDDIAEKILAQAVISPGITKVFLELLTATEDSNEVYLVNVPSSWVGSSFHQIYRLLVESREAIILLGYETHSSKTKLPALVLNPRQDHTLEDGVTNWREYELQAGDRLVVLAYEQPRWA